MSDSKNYHALYLKYKKKYLDLKNGGGAGAIIATRRLSSNKKSSSRSSSSSSSSRSSSSRPTQIAYKTKFGTIVDKENNYKLAETECNKACANIPNKTCKPEEIVKTYEDIMYSQLEGEYSNYIRKYPELLSRINNAAVKWSEFIKKDMDENKTCKTKFLASLRCENFNNYKSNNSSGNKLIDKYNAKKISFFNDLNLNSGLFVDFLDVVTSPNYEEYIQMPSKLIIQSELPFKPTNNKDDDIINFYIQYHDFKKYGFI